MTPEAIKTPQRGDPHKVEQLISCLQRYGVDQAVAEAKAKGLFSPHNLAILQPEIEAFAQGVTRRSAPELPANMKQHLADTGYTLLFGYHDMTTPETSEEVNFRLGIEVVSILAR